jgi:hypothetical protein
LGEGEAGQHALHPGKLTNSENVISDRQETVAIIVLNASLIMTRTFFFSS